MLRGVMLSSLFSVAPCMCEVSLCDVCVVSRLHLIAAFVVFRGCAVMLGSVLVVLGSLVMMRGAFVIVHCLGSPSGNRIEPGSDA